MFEIEYKGGNGVIISTKKAKIVVDPKLSLVGLKDIKTDDEIELATEPRLSVDNPDARIIIKCPGEYEVGDFTIRGTAANRHIDADDGEKLCTIYRLENANFRIAVVGNVAAKLNEEQLEAVGVVDILILPVGGGGYTLDAYAAAAIVRQIEPKVVVPVHYSDKDLKYEVPQDPLDLFVKELGAPHQTEQKYKLKSEANLPTTLTVVEIARS